ncbi:MAG: 4-hydroxythreonine-4-phosphate dehydrogenase PdxA [Putridiphycobacter sp.]|nr:4-hydroxythreonine-4-phosphate dehydrogenase PdxA [Putridiphycobacter sp.]
MSQKLIKVGITVGDINGIGLEVIIKTFSDTKLLSNTIPIIYGSSKTISFHKKMLNDESFNFLTISSADQAKPKKVNVINSWNEEVKIDLGKQNPTGGKYALLSLEAATNDLKTNKIDVLLTAPINKDGVKSAGFEFPGHTEYLAHMSNTDDVLMLMVANNLRVAVATGHVPLKDVAAMITPELLTSKLNLLLNSLRKDFAIERPKIAVLGLNPHAGDRGALGDEELNIINPVVKTFQDKGELVYGSYSADGFFGSSNIKNFDGVLAMYHDQGLTGFKAISFDEGVNYTAGLPIVRTSPDHGTAYDIAGKGVASPQSFRNAYFLACDVFKKRELYKEINANPLKPQKDTKTKPNRK